PGSPGARVRAVADIQSSESRRIRLAAAIASFTSMSDAPLLDVTHRVVTQVASAQRQTMDVSGGGDEGVGNLDSMRAAEAQPVGAGLATDAFVQLHTVEHAREVAQDECLARAHAGSDLGDRDRRPPEDVTGRVPLLQPADDVIVTPKPCDDDVAVEQV